MKTRRSPTEQSTRDLHCKCKLQILVRIDRMLAGSTDINRTDDDAPKNIAELLDIF